MAFNFTTNLGGFGTGPKLFGGGFFRLTCRWIRYRFRSPTNPNIGLLPVLAFLIEFKALIMIKAYYIETSIPSYYYETRTNTRIKAM
jgi:hypothetical protein